MNRATLTLRIGGQEFDVEAAPRSWILTRPDGAQYTVGPAECSCGRENCPHLCAFWLWAMIPARKGRRHPVMQ